MTTTTGAYLGFVARIPGFLRRPQISLEDAKRQVELEFARRNETFLAVLERDVFSYDRSPYRPLFRHAHCELGDVRRSVETSGIEATLRELRGAGVYVSFEEFKGRLPIERHGRTIPVQPRDFDNPSTGPSLRSTTGGSTGAPVGIRYTLGDIEEKVAMRLIGYSVHGVMGAPTARVHETAGGVKSPLVEARFGQRVERWFAPRVERSPLASVGFRLEPAVVAAVGRLGGARLPIPRVIGLDQMHVVAEWAAKRAGEEGRSLVRCNPSHALRIASAALERGIDLSGVTFMGGGDPATLGKAAGVARSGARLVPIYVASESGRIGLGCARPSDPSDVHVQNHQIAVISHPRRVPVSDVEVPSLHVTSIRWAAPKILVNVELDDYGTLSERECGCPFAELGFTQHLHDIYSYGKLTGDGVTLVGSTMVRVLDEVLPSRFGGSSLDYQLVEDEDARGFTRLTLVVSPVVKGEDAELAEAVFDALDDDATSRSARSIWRQAGAFRVERREPRSTRRGKVIPLAPRHMGGDDAR